MVSPDQAADFVIQGLQSRHIKEAPELQTPFPMTEGEVHSYESQLREMSYNRLLQEEEVMSRMYGRLEPALPEWRVDLDAYPHPITQRRLIALNEVYNRAVNDPVREYNQQKNKTMLEWGAAGAIAGGLIGLFTKQSTTGFALGGAILGAVAGRSAVVQQLLTEASSRLLMI
jgi:hypothetical protein